MLRGPSGSVDHGRPPSQTRDLPDAGRSEDCQAVRSHPFDTFFAHASVLSSVADGEIYKALSSRLW
jgi:hypothetical protein